MYEKLSQNIEHLSKWFYITTMILAIGVAMLPTTLMSMINYYVYDMGDESFEIPSPMMYVRK